MNKTWVVVIIVLLVAVGVYWWQGELERKSGMMTTQNTSETVIQEAPPQTVDPVSGEVDQGMFEDQQSVGEDDGIEALGAEIEGTVILEEDFSDF